jgi:hypothetical protein
MHCGVLQSLARVKPNKIRERDDFLATLFRRLDARDITTHHSGGGPQCDGSGPASTSRLKRLDDFGLETNFSDCLFVIFEHERLSRW